MASHSHSSGVRPRRAGPERDLGTRIPVGFNTPELFLLPVFAPAFSTQCMPQCGERCCGGGDPKPRKDTAHVGTPPQAVPGGGCKR